MKTQSILCGFENEGRELQGKGKETDSPLEPVGKKKQKKKPTITILPTVQF